MASDNRTRFQGLSDLFLGGGPGTGSMPAKKSVTYNLDVPQVIYKTDNKDDYLRRKAEERQQRLLAYQWKASAAQAQLKDLSNQTNIQLMFRDADLMAQEPEIGAALEIVMEEACCLNSKGRILDVYSKSKRVKAILDDLFVNRLDINIMLPMITKEMVQYGNSYMLLNIDRENGIIGWRQQEVYTMQRLEGGFVNPYLPTAGTTQTMDANNLEPQETRFVCLNQQTQLTYHSWQVAHFRNLADTQFLPYGISWLHKARRAWRMLSMMEDAMLIHRLDKSIERRIFKINVGGINEQDVQAYINQVADNFKRTPVMDPMTGQVDLRKNFLDVSADYFIPVRNGQDPSSIETLQGAQYVTAMDDIEYQHNKVLAALRVPKTFLNFQDAQGKGQNLSLMDVRFSRMIQRLQQSLLMELNKIAIIHLYLMGFTEDLTNFTLTMNNPSAQQDALELEDLSKRMEVVKNAVADPGTGIPILSMKRALRDIMKFTDEEIAEMLNEIRLEKALAMELQMTPQVIKKTGMFAQVDRLYGDPDVIYQTGEDEQEPGESGGAGGGGAASGGILGMDSLGGAVGTSGAVPMAGAPGADAGTGAAGGAAPMMESIIRRPNKAEVGKTILEQYLEKFTLDEQIDRTSSITLANMTNKNLRINDSFQKIFEGLDKTLEEVENDEEETESTDIE